MLGHEVFVLYIRVFVNGKMLYFETVGRDVKRLKQNISSSAWYWVIHTGIQLLFKFSLDSDFCHKYLHTL